MVVLPETEHHACVNAWLARFEPWSPERLLAALERGFSAVWRRAHRTLGEVTLGAIAERVLHSAAEKFPNFARLAVDPSGLRCGGLREHAEELPVDELHVGVRFVLVEFLVVLGNLTADVLTPALHAELSKIGPDESLEDDAEPRGGRQLPTARGGGSEP